MPRLLPRLLKVLQETPITSSSAKYVPRPQDVSSRKRKSLYRPIPLPLPSFHPAGRTRSILLDENLVTDKRVFARHKRLPPRVHLGARLVVHDEHDVPREMTTQEREWWSSPYRAFNDSFAPVSDQTNLEQQSECWLLRCDNARFLRGIYPTVRACLRAPILLILFRVQIFSLDSRCFACPPQRKTHAQ